MGFSLEEIKKIFNFKRMGKLTTYQRNKYYQSLYQSKVEDIKNKIKSLKSAKNNLEEKITELKKENEKNTIKLGIDLSVLSLFSCPKCNSELKLSAEKVEENQILEGSLNCECGQSLKIRDGIIYSDKYENDLGDKSKEVEENHIEDYIKSTDPDFIDKSYESLEWLKRQFENEKIENKVVMEPGSGYGHFLRQIYDGLDNNTVYICIDYKAELNKYLKKLLEMTAKKAKVIFITATFANIPIKNNSIDFLVDFTGTSDYAFTNKEFLPKLLSDYLKEDSIYIASFIAYDKFGSKAVVSLPYRDNFKYKKIKSNILDLAFEIEKEYKSEIVNIDKTMGKYEDFAQPGDRLFSYQVKAKRRS